MSNLIEFFLLEDDSLDEAGVFNSPLKIKKSKKKKKEPQPEPADDREDDDLGPGDDSDDDAGDRDDDDDDELGPDMDYDDPTGDDQPHDEDEPEEDDEPDHDEPATPFASKPVPPSPALRSGQTGIHLSGDRVTLEALQSALEAVRTRDTDLADWADDCVGEIARSLRRGSSEVILPKFEETPSLDDFDDVGDDEDF